MSNSTHPRPLGQLVTNRNGISSLAFSPDSHTLVAAGLPNDSGDDAIWLWDVRTPLTLRCSFSLSPTGQSLSQDDSSDAEAIAFSTDGLILAAGGSVTGSSNLNRGMIQLWNMSNPARPRPLGRYMTGGNTIQSLAFSPDGRTLASSEFTASATNTVQLLDVSNTRYPRLLGSPATGNDFVPAAFSRAGILATTNKNGGVQLWDAVNPVHPRPLGRPISISSDSSFDLAEFSADGRTLAIVDSASTIQMWSVANPAQPEPLSQPFSGKSNGAINSLAFSSGGRILATGGSGGIIRLWNTPPTILADSASGSVTSMAFSANSHVLASMTSNGSATLWNVASPAAPKPLSQLPPIRGQEPGSLVYSPDGRTLAELDFHDLSGSVQLWNVANPATPKPLGHPLVGLGQSDISSMAFSPDSRTLAVADGSAIQLWRIGNPGNPKLGPRISTDIAGGLFIASMAFSPDGRILASVDYTGTIELWNAIHSPATDLPLGTASTDNGISGIQSPEVIYGRNGRILTLLTTEGTIELWSASDPAKLKRLRRLSANTAGMVNSIAIGPQGILAADEGGAVQLWTPATPANFQPFGQPIINNGFVTSVAFSPDGTMASGTSAGTIFLSNLNINAAINRICAAAGNNLTPQNWHHYIPQLPYQAPCR